MGTEKFRKCFDSVYCTVRKLNLDKTAINSKERYSDIVLFCLWIKQTFSTSSSGYVSSNKTIHQN